MRLTDFSHENYYLQRSIEDLEFLAKQPSALQLRPCSECRVPCGCQARSTTCCCGCDASCPMAPQKLSSEPSMPIETAVVGAVFALASLRVVMPCWSCEGHLDGGGAIRRFPEVWFFSGSNWYPELIGRHLNHLYSRREVGHLWMVATCAGVKLDNTVYAIRLSEPKSEYSLASLHADLRVIGATLAEGVLHLCQTALHPLSAKSGLVSSTDPV